jgi:hypothetical protein
VLKKVLFLILCIMALPSPLFAVDIGLGLNFGPTFMGYGTEVGYGSNYMARSEERAKLKGFNFTVGPELILSTPVVDSAMLSALLVGLYNLRYGNESYSYAYSAGSGFGGVELDGKTEVYNVHALHNRLLAGVRLNFKKSGNLRFYTQIAAGALFYNPLYLTLHQYTGKSYGVGLGGAHYGISITDNGENLFDISLNNTNEVMFAGGVRFGFNFAYAEAEIITNGRITAVNLLLGLTILTTGEGVVAWL